MRHVRRILVLAVAAALPACSGGSTAPNPIPSGNSGPAAGAPAVLTVTSGSTGAPVGGAQVTAGGVTRPTNASGQVNIDRISSGDTVTVETGDSYLRRLSRFTPSAPTFSLWPVQPGADSTFVRELVYSLTSDTLIRPTSGVYLILSAEMQQDRAVREFQEYSASLVNRASGGAIPFVVTGSAPAGAVVFNLSIDPSLSAGTAASTRYNLNGSRITGGTIRYKTREYALDAAVAPHEMGHAYGMGHPTQLGMMHATTYDYSDFTGAESLEMHLMVLRQPGNLYPDNDTSVTAASTPRSLEIVCPAPRR
jgi:hypothetical protein